VDERDARARKSEQLELTLELFGVVPGYEGNFGNAVGGEGFKCEEDEWASGDGNERFGGEGRVGTEPAAIAGREDYRPHGVGVPETRIRLY
jgi:hypothetical protein